jgi:hypothetical protein
MFLTCGLKNFGKSARDLLMGIHKIDNANYPEVFHLSLAARSVQLLGEINTIGIVCELMFQLIIKALFVGMADFASHVYSECRSGI